MLTDEQRQAVENAVYGRTLTQANVFALADLLSVRQPAAIDKQEAAVTRDDVEQARDRILEQSKNSLFRSGVKICAGEILSPIEPCDKPPAGWTCSRTKGHEGPCAASLAAPSVEQDERGAKACPFCGGSAEVHERNTDDGKPFYVQCDGCYIEVAYAGTREASLAIWNARTASTSANGDRFDPYRLKVAEECCERLMSACTDSGCPDGVNMADWIRQLAAPQQPAQSAEQAERSTGICFFCGEPIDGEHESDCPQSTAMQPVQPQVALRCCRMGCDKPSVCERLGECRISAAAQPAIGGKS